MLFRKMDNLGIETSLLGFGCMRFPTTKDGKIDREKSEKMIDLAMKSGVNYYDSAYVYHGGESEVFTGLALDKYERSSYYIATKLPCWEVKSAEDAKNLFAEQLKRLNKDYIDFYLLHALNADSWHKMIETGALDYCLDLQSEGKIKYLGFSFHGDFNAFEEIINYRKWDFCQIQLNYMDTQDQAGIAGYEMAVKLGVPVIVMEPVKGGSLANFPDSIAENFKRINPDLSNASWAMRWVGSLSGVKVILSGMSTYEQVEDNLKTFSDFKPLNGEEQNAITEMIATLKSRVKNNCTGCNYCMPCPAGVNIPQNFGIWNQYGIYENKGEAVWLWQNNIGDDKKAKNCISCGVCEDSCPQKISIREDLAALQEQLDELHY